MFDHGHTLNDFTQSASRNNTTLVLSWGAFDSADISRRRKLSRIQIPDEKKSHSLQESRSLQVRLLFT
ncbi:hypothetical protein Enr17x_44070 [Gimesia fumaroli]|uniref:Uncharacterized protein n=1 Tax=Gimesia fumaroli TaxID=2527976 RepID=A0A518IGY7_9PLAN|nr:hypothetical protein Enr17x_44070 [Gimesia fumaroli]